MRRRRFASRRRVAAGLSDAKFWRMIASIGGDPRKVTKVVPQEYYDEFGEKFYDFAYEIADLLIEATGEIRDHHDYASWGVVAEGKSTFNKVKRLIARNPLGGSDAVIDEFEHEGEAFGDVVADLVDEEADWRFE